MGIARCRRSAQHEDGRRNWGGCDIIVNHKSMSVGGQTCPVHRTISNEKLHISHKAHVVIQVFS